MKAVPIIANARWTPDDEERLRTLVTQCVSVELIARELKRTRLAVRNCTYKLGLLIAKTTERKTIDRSQSQPPMTYFNWRGGGGK